jgi:hypothetical protein
MRDVFRFGPRDSRARTVDAPDAVRLRRAAWAFTTRRVRSGACKLVLGANAPKAGDVLLARVDEIGQHSGLQLPDGRRKVLFVGDEIVVAYGNRYAPNQFEAIVPKTLGPCQLVAGGGVAGKTLSWHASMKPPTRITPIGLVADSAGRPLNLRHFALPTLGREPTIVPAVAVVGTAMDSGKTQTAAYLVKGLTLAGLRVGYSKVTGTGAGGDTWLLKDAGAHPVIDFTDAGLASTYLETPAELQRVFVTLVSHLTRSNVDAIVLEVADGVLQAETAALLESDVFRELVRGVLFASGDAMGAVAGATWLRERNLPVLGLSGILTAAPLQRLEAGAVTGLPAFSRQDLGEVDTAMSILNLGMKRRTELARVMPRAEGPPDASSNERSPAAPAVAPYTGDTLHFEVVQ